MTFARSGAVIGTFTVLFAVTAFLMPQADPPAPGASQDFLDAAEFRRLMGVKVVFRPVKHEVNLDREGLGEHHGGKPPVTPHPDGPAFGPGVKVAMSDAEFFQFYQAYQSPKHPVFVTSDSLIQAYFTVLRKELIRLEAVDVWGLRDAVVEGLKKIDDLPVAGPQEIIDSARRLARINLAIVARLFDPGAAPLARPEDEKVVQEEVERVQKAEAVHLPSWLHEPAEDLLAIDYRRFRPTGDRPTEYSKRRFRAVRWLQVVPWRIDRDDQLLAILLAARATESDGRTALRDRVGTILMPPDDVDSVQVAQWYGIGSLDVAQFEKVREAAAKKSVADPPRLNDALRFAPNGPQRLTARWRSAGRSTDLVSLNAVFGQKTPNGLALCASLGSPFAQSRPEAGDWSKASSLIEGDTLGAEWWKTAAALFGPTPKGAPAFMEHLEWRIKSCQTVLGGWVLWRHAVELFGKSDTRYANGGPPKLRGTVEPNPEFFKRMERLIALTLEELKRKKSLDQTPRRCAAMIPEILEGRIRAGEFFQKTNDRKKDEFGPLGRRHEVELLRRRAFYDSPWQYYIKSADGNDDLDVEAAGLVQLWSAANEHRWPMDPNAVNVLKMFDDPTEKQLTKLSSIAARCRELAEKQLAGVPFTDSDDSWFLDYGRKLAGIAGYTGDADDQPLDDAPKISDVVYDPPKGSYRVAAVGRPRALWVLYPYRGAEVLCRGAVYPYFEFDTTEKPNDEAWQQKVRAGKQPAQPEWISRLLAKGTPEIGAGKGPR